MASMPSPYKTAAATSASPRNSKKDQGANPKKQKSTWRNTPAIPDEHSDESKDSDSDDSVVELEVWEPIKDAAGFNVKGVDYRYSLEISAVSVLENNSSQYHFVLYVLFNPPVWFGRSKRGNKTVDLLINMTLKRGQKNAFKNEEKLKNVMGFKIVNLYSEVQSEPEDVNVTDKKSMIDPEGWNKWANDPNCVAIVAAWGQIRMNEKPVKDRRNKVAKWLNRNHSGKVGTLKSSSGVPRHPGYFLRNKDEKPVFEFGEVPVQ